MDYDWAEAVGGGDGSGREGKGREGKGRGGVGFRDIWEGGEGGEGEDVGRKEKERDRKWEQGSMAIDT